MSEQSWSHLGAKETGKQHLHWLAFSLFILLEPPIYGIVPFTFMASPT